MGDGTGRWTFTPIAGANDDAKDEGEDATDRDAASSPASRCPTTPGGGLAAGDLIRVLEEIRALEKRLEKAGEWEARVKELDEALQVREA